MAHLTTTHEGLDPRVFQKEARSMRAAGMDVTVVAVHDGSEVIDGISVLGIRKNSRISGRLFGGIAEILERIPESGADIYHIHDIELVVVGLWLKLRGKKVVFDVHEDFAALASDRDWVSPYLAHVVGFIVRFLNRLSSRYFDLIVAATPKIATLYSPDKTIIVRNMPRTEDFAGGEQGAAPGERPPHFAYIGGISRSRGIFEITEALNRMTDRPDVRLRLAGPKPDPALQQQLDNTPGWSRVQYEGYLDRNAIGNLLSGVRAGLVTLWPVKNHIESYPVKLFEYMAAGLPVIASDFPLWRELLDGAECCIFVDPRSAEETAGAMRWILDHTDEAAAMGARAREAVQERFNWTHEARILVRAYEEKLAR